MIDGAAEGGTFPTQPHSFIIKYEMGNTAKSDSVDEVLNCFSKS